MDPTLDSYSILNPGVSTLLDTTSLQQPSNNVAAVNTLTAPSATPSFLDTLTNTFGSAVNTLESVFTTSTQTALNATLANANTAAAQRAAVGTAVPATSNSKLMMYVLLGLGVILLVRK